jgi:hypothetical protein
MKTWTGDEWRPVSESEARYRIDNGFPVREDDEPDDPPGVVTPAKPASKPKTSKTSPKAVDSLSDDELERLTAPDKAPGGGDHLG